MPTGYEPFDCYEDLSVPLPRPCCCNGSDSSLKANHRQVVFREPLGGFKRCEVLDYNYCRISRVFGASPPAIVAHTPRLGVVTP